MNAQKMNSTASPDDNGSDKILRSAHLHQVPKATTFRDQEEKEVIYATPDTSEKEVRGADGKEVVRGSVYGLSTSTTDREEPLLRSGNNAPSGGRRRLWVWTIAIVISIILLVGLGVGLGIGLTRSRNSAHQQSGGVQVFSTRGAFNGTGISSNSGLITPTTASETDSIFLIYQDYSGGIQLLDLKWPEVSKIRSEIIASDAKNGTPISITGLKLTGLEQKHVFYVGKDQLLKQQIYDNSTLTWTPGPLNAQKIKVFDSDKIGMHTAYYAGPILNHESVSSSPGPGLRLWFAETATTFSQWAWRPGFPAWLYEQNWQGLNSVAVPTADGILPGHTTYVMFVNEDNDVEMFWRDTANNVESTSAHPINEWVKVSNTLPAVDPDVGLTLGWNNELYAKSAASDTFQGWNISFAAENTTFAPSPLPPFNGDCLPDSILDIYTDSANASTKALLFCQTIGDDITMFSAKPASESWEKTVLPLQ